MIANIGAEMNTNIKVNINIQKTQDLKVMNMNIILLKVIDILFNKNPTPILGLATIIDLIKITTTTVILHPNKGTKIVTDLAIMNHVVNTLG